MRELIAGTGGRRAAAVALFAVLGMVPIDSAAGQTPLGRPAADSARLDAVFEELQAQIEILFPAMHRLARSLESSIPEVDPQTRAAAIDAAARRAARLTRAYFDALVAEGFTREEALRIVSAGPPGGDRR